MSRRKIMERKRVFDARRRLRKQIDAQITGNTVKAAALRKDTSEGWIDGYISALTDIRKALPEILPVGGKERE